MNDEKLYRASDFLQGANLSRSPVDIGRACMPLVRLLAQDGLSWYNRQQIADAIAENLRIYADHQAEMQHLQQGAACGQARKSP